MATALDGTSSKQATATDDILDYNDAFPQLTASVRTDGIHKNQLFSSAYSSTNGNNGVSSLPGTTNAVYAANKAEEDRRRKLVTHASTVTTKIIEIPPEERVLDKNDNTRRGQNQLSRTSGATQPGQALQKICSRIQKETTTSITFLHKDQTLLVTITGRPEQVRLAQVQLLREIQRPTKLTVNIPSDFHRYIIGTRGATLKQLEQDTLTTIKVPRQEEHSDGIIIEGAKDNVKSCEEKILQLYRTQSNKGFERLNIPFLYHPWIRNLTDDLSQKYNVTINIPPLSKPVDEILIRGEREPVDQTKARIMEYFKSLEGKIMTFPLEIPCEQHRFILGKKGAGLKEIFEKTKVFVRIPTQEENLPIIQVIGETSKIGEAITMIYKMASALTAVQISAPSWMQNSVRGDHNTRIEALRKNHPDVRVIFRDDHIAIEGPPEEVEHVRKDIQTTIDDLRKKNIVCVQVEIDPQYYKQLIGKNQARVHEIQDQTTSEIKFPPTDEGRIVQIMATKENAEKARQLLLERVQKLSNETSTEVTIDPQYYPQLIGSKGKNLEEIRAQFHNIQITIPEANGKSNKVTVHGNKEDVEKCTKFLQQKFKDFHSVEITVPKRVYPMLIGKSGANIQRLREKVPEVRLDLPSLGETKESSALRLNGKKNEVEKAKKILEEHIEQLNTSMENTIEQTITIDSKWHNRFFQKQQKLLNDLQQQYDVLIRLPKREAVSDQVILRGSKDILDQVRKRIEELIDTWENTVTKEVNVSHRHHGYLLAHSGAHIQPIQKEYNVQIKFPPRGNDNKDDQENQIDESQLDIVRISGRSEHVDQAIVALEKIVPIETSVDIPVECHGSLVGKGGANVQALAKQYPDVQITFPPLKSAQDTILLRGQRDQVELVRKELLDSYEKYQADRQARSFEVHLTIRPEYRSLLFGNRGRTINSLRQKHEVKIDVSQNQTPLPATVPTPTSTNNEEESQQQQTEHNQPADQHDDQQAIPQENALVTSENSSTNALNDIEVTITGYEDKAIACRDEIVQMIKDFEAKITMEIEIDPRVHARIIGSGGYKLQQIMKDFDVDIKFQTNNQSDKVHVIGLDQEKIEACIDHLLVLEEDYLQDLPYRPTTNAQNSTEYSLGQVSNVQQQEVPSTSRGNRNDGHSQKNKQQQQQQQQRQAPFQLKNAPWTNGNDNENDKHHHQNSRSGHQRNGHEHSPKKSQSTAPNRDDLGEYPTFANGVSSKLDEPVSEVQTTTVNPMPVIWGPPKRNH